MEINDINPVTIGNGGYGKVCLVEHNGLKLARKEINISDQPIDVIKKEIEMLETLRDRNVLILKDSLIDESKNICYIYTEYVKNGDLWRIIDEKREKKEDFSIKV